MTKHLKYIVKGTLSIIGFMWAPLLIGCILAFFQSIWPGTFVVAIVLFIGWWAGITLESEG